MTALDDLCSVPFHDADAALRARILSRLADTELSVALLQEAEADRVRFRMFDLPAGPVALAFDRDDRLGRFFGRATPYVAMPGRVLAAALAAEGAGLLVNPGQRSEMLLDADALGWLRGALGAAPEPASAATAPRPAWVAPAAGAVEALAGPLAERLADLRGMIAGAALVGTAGSQQTAGHLLLIAGAAPADRDAIAKALAETLAFVPEVPGGVDIGFSDGAVPPTALVFDLAGPDQPPAPRRDGPPRLR